MTTALQIAANSQQVDAVRQELADIPNGVQRVLVRSVNKVAVSARTKIVRIVAGTINVTQDELRRRNVSLRKANYEDPSATINVIGRRIPLKNLSARQTRSGVSYAVRRGGRTMLAHSFMTDRGGKPITMKSGHTGVFIRRDATSAGTATTNYRHGRRRFKGGSVGSRRHGLPIVELHGPSVPVAMENIEELSAGVLDHAISQDLGAEISTQTDLVLARHGSGFEGRGAT